MIRVIFALEIASFNLGLIGNLCMHQGTKMCISKTMDGKVQFKHLMGIKKILHDNLGCRIR